MGRVRKERWLGHIFMKLSFWWLKNLILGTFGWMLEHSSHCSVIVAYNDINDKETIIEGILYHLQNWRSLHTFWASLEVLWELMFFWFFSSFFRSIKLSAGRLIEFHYNDPLAPCPNDEGVSAGGVISPAGGSLQPIEERQRRFRLGG